MGDHWRPVQVTDSFELSERDSARMFSAIGAIKVAPQGKEIWAVAASTPRPGPLNLTRKP
jgi:hypothetical protein